MNTQREPPSSKPPSPPPAAPLNEQQKSGSDALASYLLGVRPLENRRRSFLTIRAFAEILVLLSDEPCLHAEDFGDQTPLVLEAVRVCCCFSWNSPSHERHAQFLMMMDRVVENVPFGL